jgi:hypothetical protein
MAGTGRWLRPFLCEEELAMSETRDRPDVQPDKPIHPGAPKQALSGGGSETHAGSDEGGSAYGDDREDPEEAKAAPKAPEGGFKDAAAAPDAKPAEEKTFAAPDGEEGAGAATEAVTNTGEPRPVKKGEGVEGQPGDDVDAATG